MVPVHGLITQVRPDWNATYYHKADSAGIGFNRTGTGSNALSQYAPEVKAHWENLQTCPDEYLLWFHHLSWNYKMRSGNHCGTKWFITIIWVPILLGKWGLTWDKMQGKVDAERFALKYSN
jgi:alpha-glucuronidase